MKTILLPAYRMRTQAEINAAVATEFEHTAAQDWQGGMLRSISNMLGQDSSTSDPKMVYPILWHDGTIVKPGRSAVEYGDQRQPAVPFQAAGSCLRLPRAVVFMDGSSFFFDDATDMLNRIVAEVGADYLDSKNIYLSVDRYVHARQTFTPFEKIIRGLEFGSSISSARVTVSTAIPWLVMWFPLDGWVQQSVEGIVSYDANLMVDDDETIRWRNYAVSPEKWIGGEVLFIALQEFGRDYAVFRTYLTGAGPAVSLTPAFEVPSFSTEIATVRECIERFQRVRWRLYEYKDGSTGNWYLGAKEWIAGRASALPDEMEWDDTLSDWGAFPDTAMQDAFIAKIGNDIRDFFGA